MNKLSIAFVFLSTLFFVGCGQTPMTDADMAEKHGFTLEEYQEQKEAAARMNMTIEDHLGMGDMGEMSESEKKSHEQAAAEMGMTLEEHIDAGHVGH